MNKIIFSFTECSQQAHLYNGKCFENCPKGTFNQRDPKLDDRLKMRRDIENSYSNICKVCYKGCIQCNGPRLNDCMLMDNSITYEESSTNTSSINDKYPYDTKNLLKIILRIFIFILVIILLVIVSYLLHQKIVFKRNIQKRNSSKFQYKSLTQNIDELTPLPQAQLQDEDYNNESEEKLIKLLS